MKQKNFFFILYSICSGTKKFPELSKNGYIKAFWHLIILTIICSIGFTLVNMQSLRKDITGACSALNQEFGGIDIEKNGIYPKIGRDKKHYMEYQFFQIVFLPNQAEIENLKLNLNLHNSGIIWTPDFATGWLKINNEQIILYPVLSNLSNTNFFSIYSINYLHSYLKQNQKLTDLEHLVLRLFIHGNIPVVGAFLLKRIDNFDVLIPILIRWSSVVIMIGFFATAVLNTLFYGLIFALIYRFTLRNNYNNYTFKNFFIIALYAAFPAIIIGTLLSLTKTQWLDYSTIFIITFVIYLFFILNNLKTSTKNISD